MKRIENLYEIIKKENIIYEERNLERLGSKGIYIKLDGINPLIAIDSSIVNTNSTYISILLPVVIFWNLINAIWII